MNPLHLFIFGLVIGALAAGIVAWAYFATCSREHAAARAATNAAAAAAAAVMPGKSATWHAVPGHKIELAGTGFVIAMNTDAHRAWYTLYSPEGLRMAEINDLPTAKSIGERFAAEREEFTYRGVPPQRAQA